MSISKTLRTKVKIMQQNNCWYCGKDNPKTIDHVVSISHGGSDDIDNLVMACKTCNSTKRELSVSDFRFAMSWKKTRYSDVISHGKAKKLMLLGVSFDDFNNDHKFWFEGLL